MTDEQFPDGTHRESEDAQNPAIQDMITQETNQGANMHQAGPNPHAERANPYQRQRPTSTPPGAESNSSQPRQHPYQTWSAPPQFNFPPQRPSADPKSIVSLVTGIASIVLSLVPVIGFGLGLTGIITGALTLSRREQGRGMALAGVITGSVGVFINIVFWLIVIIAAIVGPNTSA